MFTSTMMSGTILSISSMSWFTAWIGLEINMLSIIPLMKNFNNKLSAESAIKYFMIQTMASMILLFSVLLYSNSLMFNFKMMDLITLLLSLTLLMKMGAAPMHFWLPEVISGSTWYITFIILTWQKINPMILMSYLPTMKFLMISIILLSSLIGGLMGLNQTCLKKILAYSSINHIGWMLAALIQSTLTWMIYFLIYSLINLILMSNFYINNTNTMFQLSKLLSKNKINKFIFSMNFLSLGGLPPFLGFFPKWLTIFNLSINNMHYLSFMLIIFTLLSLFMYIRIIFTNITLLNNESMKLIIMNKSYNLLSLCTNLSMSFMLIILSMPLL
uniref:NADH-ubiquinone oxidoreductase chain 2 n=1 Tax=Scolytinae sp. BMNH 1040331 TaxID=1903791 RepID=A0A343A4S4_9CUCU|nr:NADH dehydrogenase subunit 2 [Scolytinae sp. BMNH 1040331]